MNRHAFRNARIAAAALLLGLAGCATTDFGDEAYRPAVGQQGKDVMWVPTLDGVVMPMLEVAKVTADDIVYDLGAGDGKIPIWAARRFGARAVGIEYDADLAALARRNAERAGVSDRVRIIHGDIFKEDFSSATVLTLYLGTALNLRLMPTILRMPAGTRVVSNAFDMGTWVPDQTLRFPDKNPVYYWVVPARFEGEWRLTGLPGSAKDAPAVLKVAQTFQMIEGSLALSGGRTIPIQGRLDGKRLTLDYRDADGTPRRLVAEAGGEAFEARLDASPNATVSGRRIR